MFFIIRSSCDGDVRRLFSISIDYSRTPAGRQFPPLTPPSTTTATSTIQLRIVAINRYVHTFTAPLRTALQRHRRLADAFAFSHDLRRPPPPTDQPPHHTATLHIADDLIASHLPVGLSLCCAPANRLKVTLTSLAIRGRCTARDRRDFLARLLYAHQQENIPPTIYLLTTTLYTYD